jgi:membrane protein YdbS with pleckstrin-like domain
MSVPEFGDDSGSAVSLLFYALAGFAGLGALFVLKASPPTAVVKDGEPHKEYYPTQRVAIVYGFIGLSGVIAGHYLLFYTMKPIAWGVLSSSLGLWMFSKATVRLWRHTLTIYYITKGHVVKEYRLLGIKKKKMPRTAIQASERNMGPVQRLLNVGWVKVESAGDSGTSAITATNLEDPKEFLRVANT